MQWTIGNMKMNMNMNMHMNSNINMNNMKNVYTYIYIYIYKTDVRTMRLIATVFSHQQNNNLRKT